MRDGDTIEIVIDRKALHGTVDLIGEGEERFSAEEGRRRLAARTPRNDLAQFPGKQPGVEAPANQKVVVKSSYRDLLVLCSTGVCVIECLEAKK